LAPRRSMPLTRTKLSEVRHWSPIGKDCLLWVLGVCSAPGGICV
jgi:hypothetical protein